MRDQTLKRIKKKYARQAYFTIADAVKMDIHPEVIRRMTNKGEIDRIRRGAYRVIGAELTEKNSLALAAKAVPKGVICLATALRFHGITTQLPAQVWIAIENKMWRTKQIDTGLQLVFFSGESFTSGVEDHLVEGVTVRVYNPAKTVADCFKYRNKIGLDVALEALKEGRRSRKFTADELTKYARIDRVLNVIKPYMEAVF
ncbi:TPA: transcriptional regulator [Candidatus Edwardsbacteria bacterium]|nr:transcriptional regulator [Candidatus Edwardsbacteria bacterium]HBZ86618.1 transcriptional regulator [Candidatus Edwardsbacteria bacterium]